jgi:mannose/fructose/N-acetylgalactosamine-specific phosphotransferase system component IID
MISRTDLTAAFLRTFAIQGSWNYRTLLGGGLAYAMLPLLVRIHSGDPVALRRAVRRHASSFNGHPYLCSMAVGSLARLEHDGLDPARIERFRTALRGPLGAIGDRVVWAGWRPFCLLSAIIAFCLGLEEWKAVVAFLSVYNAGHLWLRLWGFRTGWREGLGVGSALARSPLKYWATVMIRANLVLLGLATVLLVLRVPLHGSIGPVAGGAAVIAGLGAYMNPTRGGSLAIGLLMIAAVVWLI